MSWLAWLAVAVVVAAVATVTGIKPKGTRPVSHTRLLAVSRFALLVLAALILYLALRARSGG